MNSARIHISETGLYDYHKEAFGVKGRHYKEWWTQDEVDEEYATLEAIVIENIKDREEMNAASLIAFRKLIRETMDRGAGDWRTAVRWLAEAEDEDADNYHSLEHFLFNQHLGWTNIKKVLTAFFTEGEEAA